MGTSKNRVKMRRDAAEMSTGFDNLVETKEAVESFFVESNWEVDWETNE